MSLSLLFLGNMSHLYGNFMKFCSDTASGSSEMVPPTAPKGLATSEDRRRATLAMADWCFRND